MDWAGQRRQANRAYLACARQLPMGSMRQQLQRIAREKEGQARRLLALCWVLTGEKHPLPVPTGKLPAEPWREMLRRRWFEEQESAGQLERMAGQLPVLENLLAELAGEDRRHAGILLRLLAQSLA